MMELEDLAPEEVVRIFGDLLKLIRHVEDCPEDQIPAIRMFCAYHGLIDDGYYSQMPKEKLRDCIVGEFNWLGEKPTTIEMTHEPAEDE